MKKLIILIYKTYCLSITEFAQNLVFVKEIENVNIESFLHILLAKTYRLLLTYDVTCVLDLTISALF